MFLRRKTQRRVGGYGKVKRMAKKKKKKVATDIFIHYNQKGRGFEKTKTRVG